MKKSKTKNRKHKFRFKFSKQFVSVMIILTPLVAAVSAYMWFTYTYGFTPYEVFLISQNRYAPLDNLALLPGYVEVESLPGYLDRAKDTLGIIRQVSEEEEFYDYDLTRLAKCESTFNPNAVNRISNASGLFQYLPSTWKTTPYADQDIFNPEAQVLATIWMFRQGRYREWECYRPQYHTLS